MDGAAAEAGYTFSNPEGLLAHYTRAEVAFGNILPCGNLRMSPYRDMRDPAENQDVIPAVAWRGEPQGPERALSHAYGLIKDVRDSMRVLSFTHDAIDDEGAARGTFDCCWARPRMWEQYGDVHRGVCLVFARARLEDVLRAELGRHAAPYLGDVRYSRAGIAEGPSRTLVDDRIFDEAHRDQAITEFIEGHRDDFFFLKTDDWATEREFRAVLPKVKDHHHCVGFADSLVAVVVGHRFPRWQLPGAHDACERAEVDLRMMTWCRGRPLALRRSRPNVV